MKICIISGGSGSVQLKKGLSKYVPIENIYTLVNAYDNGLSTGLVRKVFNGDILGPSDIRKQQLLDYSNYRDDIKTESSEKLYSILKQRVTFLKNPKDEFLKIADQIHEYPIFKESIELFFEQPLSKKIKYIDFSIANIFYSSLMFQYGAQKTADIVADLLNLPKNIILNSDEVLYLGALTESNNKILDEGDLVNYNNENDKIKDIFLFDKNGNIKIPELSNRAKTIINESDLIILSSGTQFSSLIPTYITKGFKEAIKDKETYLIRNIGTDLDMTGYSIKEQDDIIKKYVSYSKSFADNKFALEQDIKLDLALTDKKHKEDIAFYILKEYLELSDKIENIFIDYDDTIISRNENDINISLKTKDLIEKLSEYLDVCIVTGKSYKEVSTVKVNSYLTNYGCRFIKDNNIKDILVLDKFVYNKLYNVLKKIQFNFSLYENRDGNIISLRFLDKDYRNVLYEYLSIMFKDNLDIKILKAGTGTIDIIPKDVDKLNGIISIFNHDYIKKSIYIGDEDEGNDKNVLTKLDNYKSYKVNSPYDTYTILMLLKDIKGL